jgi:hypothetical protein
MSVLFKAGKNALKISEIDIVKMSVGGGRGRRTTAYRVFHFKQRHNF